ncbi:hypothetical protein G5B47_15315 [Paenibacillus sp. 7124]|uniref:Uncharacterized protein n=1 Tax=Paenibacillus apii TaxID=1850370 RepID=A0A6M1PMT4_9BACL|nr:hypothetical protein [Paenibacillus apii]NGM83788.1 hypothetical protein [Paenibacillus apii]NJJ41109.1 hypothetical protein [Paenibacillus apii]
MKYISIYILSIIIGIGLIIYGRRAKVKASIFLGGVIISIDILVPFLSFIAGFIDGYQAK